MRPYLNKLTNDTYMKKKKKKLSKQPGSDLSMEFSGYRVDPQKES